MVGLREDVVPVYQFVSLSYNIAASIWYSSPMEPFSVERAPLAVLVSCVWCAANEVFVDPLRHYCVSGIQPIAAARLS